MNELSYSFHLGNDKNKTKKAKQMKSKIETSSFNNNAIQNSKHLSKVNHHNLRKYENNDELIRIIKGSNNIVTDVKELYKKEFDKAKEDYNKKQTRSDRVIKDYFEKISNDTKHDLACEIIIELGDMTYWENKDMEEKYKMVSVFEKQVEDLERLVPSFKVANATVHFDESSPHLHIVGIAIKENCKTGMEKQVGKTSIFTKDSLKTIQDEMRKACIKSYNEIYGLNAELKKKSKGRNKDYKVSQMQDYEELVKNYDKQSEYISKVTDNTKELDLKTKNAKNIVESLKTQPLNKNNYVISNENKEKLLAYFNDVKDSSDKVKDITDFSVSISKVKEDLEQNYSKVEELETKVYEKNLENEKLRQAVLKQDKDIKKYKEENRSLKQENNKLQKLVDFFSELFNKLKRFLERKLYKKPETRDKYMDFSKELYHHGILDYDDFNNLRETYEYNKENLEDRDKDDFGLGL